MIDKVKYRIKLGRRSYVESLGLAIIMPFLGIVVCGCLIICIILFTVFCIGCIPLGILGLIHIEKDEEK